MTASESQDEAFGGAPFRVAFLAVQDDLRHGMAVVPYEDISKVVSSLDDVAKTLTVPGTFKESEVSIDPIPDLSFTVEVRGTERRRLRVRCGKESVTTTLDGAETIRRLLVAAKAEIDRNDAARR